LFYSVIPKLDFDKIPRLPRGTHSLNHREVYGLVTEDIVDVLKSILEVVLLFSNGLDHQMVPDPNITEDHKREAEQLI